MTSPATQNLEPWVGYRNGLAAAEYPDRWAADAALRSHAVDMVAPGRLDSDRTCPYCGHRFETPAQREAHVPCPEPRGDRRS